MFMSHVKIRVEGHLDKAWMEWFEGIYMTHLEENQTLLSGHVRDQAALYGLIAKLRDLGAKLISVNYGGGTSMDITG
jgi:hypothetical protein